MKEWPLISLIIPCYNAQEEWVERALNSARNQTYPTYEILVIDDGSREEYHSILVDNVTGEIRVSENLKVIISVFWI